MIFVQVPLVHSFGKTKGCEDAPCKILESLAKTGKKFKMIEINLARLDLESSERTVFQESLKIFEENKGNNEKIILLGGDHSISFPIFNAFTQVYNLSYLFVLDAHVDCMLPMKEPSHEEWLRALIDHGFSVSDLMLVGTRKIYPEEKEFMKKCKIKMISVKDIGSFLNGNEFDKLKEFEAIYVSLDLDVLDSGFFQATGYPERNGLNPEDVKGFLKKIFGLKNFKALDIVEYNPEKDLNGKNLEMVVDILKEVIK